MLEKKPAIFYCLYFCSAVLKAFYEPWYAYQHVSKKEKHVLNLILVTIQLCRQKSTKIGVNSNSLFAWLENYYTQFPPVATSFYAGKAKRHTPAYAGVFILGFATPVRREKGLFTPDISAEIPLDSRVELLYRQSWYGSIL